MAPLKAIKPITSRKMFGGVGIYCDGIFFAVIDDDKLYFKSNETNAADYDRYDAAQWIIAGEPPSLMPYREVPESVRNNPDLLAGFIDAAVAVANAKKAKPKKK